MHPTAQMIAPDLLLEGEGRVSSASFGDVYFSRASGEEETKHVFLAANGLPQRFAQARHFTIGELGFGTGLNFLVAWKTFLQTPGSGHLHYISVEKFPLTREQFAALHPEAEALLAHYPLRLPGWHRIQLERCTLTLGFGDAETLLRDADATIDAWFLDGFAPAKNAAMWSDHLLAHVARLTVAGGTFATFTAAGFVKRSLQANGFTVEKQRGYAHKRDMLAGRKTDAGARPIPTIKEAGEVLVVGAGIAGATAAHAMAERGWRVTVLEAATVAGAASGNPAAVLFPQLTKFYTPATQWHLSGYALMLRNLKRWNIAHHQPGLLVMPRQHDAATIIRNLQPDPAIARLVTAEEASAIAGTRLASEAIFLPEGTWIEPGMLCRQLLQHPHIRLHEQHAVESMTRAAGHWQVQTAQGAFRTAHLVLCTAQHATEMVPDMPVGMSAGQVSEFARNGLGLRCIVSQHGYMIPTNDRLVAGATYDHHDRSLAVTEANHATNRAHAMETLPEWVPGEIIAGRTSLRATTPDRLPYVGAVEPGLYVSIGHGSRGMISAPLAAEIIAAQITGEMVPLTPVLQAAIHPKRRAPASS